MRPQAVTAAKGGNKVQFKDLWGALLRRWYLVLITILITAGASALVVSEVGPTYQAKGAVLLIPPGTTVQQASTSSGTLGNPFLSLSGLNQARDIVVQTLAAKTTYLELCQRKGDAPYQAMRGQLCKPRPSVTYEATPDFTSSAPVILVTVEAKSAADAVTAQRALMDRVPLTLTQLQSSLNLRPRAEIKSLPLVTDNNPDVVHKTQIRAGIVAGAGTLGLGLLLIALLDGWRGAGRSGQVAVPVLAAHALETPPVDDITGWEWDGAGLEHPDQPDHDDRKPPGDGVPQDDWDHVSAART